jgi:hypothetical protein
VQLDWKPATLAFIAALALMGAGCSGINTSRSVSPATFLLPGYFGQTTPPAAPSPVAAPAETAVPTLAQVR